MVFSCAKNKPHHLSYGILDMDGRRFEINGNNSATFGENPSNDSITDSSGIRERAHGISEAWRRTLANRDNHSIFKGERRPSLSVKKLKHEIGVILNAEVSSASDKNVYELVQNMLFLLYEAELHKKMLNLDCKRLKDVFERDVTIIREIHAKQNIPVAITNSILDTRLPSFKMPSSGNTSALPPLSKENLNNNSKNNNRISAEHSWSCSDVATPSTSPNNVIAPPPAPALPPIPSISLPDVTKPPPPIAKIASAPNSSLLSSRPISGSDSHAFPTGVHLPACATIPPWSPTKPPPAPLWNPALSIGQFSYKPSVAFQYSGPYGPPINPTQVIPECAKGYDRSQVCGEDTFKTITFGDLTMKLAFTKL